MLYGSLSDNTPVTDPVDGVEFRLDLSTPAKITTRPVMFTFPGASEKQIEELLEQKPDYLDLDGSMRPEFIAWAAARTKVIVSYHNFEQTPDLESIYQNLIKHPAYGYKIAALARSTNEALRMLLFGKQHPNLSVICMGEYGQFARVLGPVVGNLIDYASIGAPTAPGQLSALELLQTYRYRSLGPQTALYGLIGDPVSQSLGHIYHNTEFVDRNAVYVKMAVKENELPEFFRLAKEIGFRGLSVTMPLKEKVLPYLDEIDPTAEKIGAVNTLKIENGRIYGTNTDGAGALDALGDVSGKHIVLLGSGGASRAIAYTAKQRGAHLTILHRSHLHNVPPSYDILINCTPSSMPIDPSSILPTALVMDLVYTPRDTPFLQAAALRGCRIIYGETMFKNQAARQQKYWF